MIDFLKLVHECTDISKFVDDHRDQMTCTYNFGTGEVIPPLKFAYRQYTVTIRSNEKAGIHFIEVTGSLHKSHFDGPNYERFTFQCLQQEIVHLCKYLNIAPDHLRIQNLEVGVNVQTNFRPFIYLKNNLLLYKRKEFKPYDKGVDSKELGYYCPGIPIIKIYDKGKQYDLPYNLMRYEVRFKKSQPLNKMEIFTLADLQDISKIQSLGAILNKTWKDVLLYETDIDLTKTGLSAAEKKFYRDCAHTKNWLKWKGKSRTGYYNQQKKLKSFISRHGINKHRIVASLIQLEVEECTNIPAKESSEVYISTHKLKCSSVYHSPKAQTHDQQDQLPPNSEADSSAIVSTD